MHAIIMMDVASRLKSVNVLSDVCILMFCFVPVIMQYLLYFSYTTAIMCEDVVVFLQHLIVYLAFSCFLIYFYFGFRFFFTSNIFD